MKEGDLILVSAEAWKNGKGYGKAHHSGTENESYPVNTGNTRL
jgi:hypothetical protein